MAENDFYSLDGAKNVAILQIRCSMLVSGCVEFFCFSSELNYVLAVGVACSNPA